MAQSTVTVVVFYGLKWVPRNTTFALLKKMFPRLYGSSRVNSTDMSWRCGTENVNVAAMQRFFRRNATDAKNPSQIKELKDGGHFSHVSQED